MLADASAPRGMHVLVTGGHGFVGARLVSALRRRHPDWDVNVPPAPGSRHGLEVTDADAVLRHISSTAPNVVVHLAAVAAVTTAIKDPRRAWDVNLGGTLNLVLALQDRRPQCRLLHISSAEVYGESLNAGAASEETPMKPMNPYAASKAAAEMLVGQAARAGLQSVIARPFNHTGAGQSEAFVVPSFAGQIARIEAGLQPPLLSVGNLDEERDFLDVADVVDAYVMMIEGDVFGPATIFNVASERSVRIGDILDCLLSMASVSIEVRQDSARLRPTPIPRVSGDASRLHRRLGWTPRVPLKDTLAAVLAAKRAEGSR